MAKLNVVNSQHQADYPLVVSIFGSLGVLMCLIVSVVGIKLWWFKHRLSFEQTPTQNGSAGGGGGGLNPPTVVTRRQKKNRSFKDKRWSQQIYENVEVHGVFKQKTEDDMEFHRPTQLPPVRIRNAESEPCLILPPPRYKRKQEEIQQPITYEQPPQETFTRTNAPSITQSQETQSPPTLTRTNTPSITRCQETLSPPISLKGNATDTSITLTFEEFEEQLRLHSAEAVKPPTPVAVISEIPKRPNRSNSTAVQEKPHRFLKSSQSIAVPEHRKVIERRPTGFHRPTEDDLTKIDDLEEPRFEKFGDRRPTGYIKYEEVDFHLNELRRDYETAELMYDSGYLENSSSEQPAIDALRNEEIVYNAAVSPEYTDFNTSAPIYGSAVAYTKPEEKSKERRNYNDFSKSSVGEYSDVKEINMDINPKRLPLNAYKSENDFATQPTYSERYDEPSSRDAYNQPKFNKTEKEFEPLPTYSEMNDDPSSLDVFDYKAKEVPSVSSQTMEPQAFAFSDDDLDEEQDFLFKHNDVRGYSKTSDTGKTFEPEQTSGKGNTEIGLYETIDITRLKEEGSYETHTGRESKIVSLYGQTFGTEDFEETPKHYDKDIRFAETQQIVNNWESPNDNLSDLENQRSPTNLARSYGNKEIVDKLLPSSSVTFDVNLQSSEGYDDKFTLNQRRPTEFSRFKFEQEKDEVDRPTIRFDLKEGDQEQLEDKFTLNQRRPTAYETSQDVKEELYEEIQVQNAKFYNQNLKRDFVKPEELYEEIITSALQPNTPPNNSQQLTINLKSNEDQFLSDYKTSNSLEHVHFDSLDDKPKLFAPVRKSKIPKIATDHETTWQELESDIQSDFALNIEEEFNKIRHSFEINEADFLEIKDDLLQLSPITELVTSPLANAEPVAFGKSIEDDWENFEKLKNSDTPRTQYEIVEDREEVQITYNKGEGNDQAPVTVSILKETKFEQGSDESLTREVNPRKSKVTFDFNTEEHVIPARKSPSEEDTEDEYDDDDDYTKPLPPIPMQRLTVLKNLEKQSLNPVVTSPTTISLFGSQVSPDGEGDYEDSWTAIKKHRNLTSQFQNLTLDSSTSPPPPSYPPPPLPISRTKVSATSNAVPKPAYRNPMAQLAVQRAQEVRLEMDGFKARSIKDAKKNQNKRSSQEFVQLNDKFDDTEA